MSRLDAALIVSVLVVTLGAGTDTDPVGSDARELNSAAAGSSAQAGLRLPPVDAAADYQLGGAYPPPHGVRVVTRDRSARPSSAAYDICYLNGFQTQPGALPWWRSHRRRLLLRDDDGRLVRDPGWPREVLLDTSTAGRRRSLAAVMTRWIDGCRANGFQAVEPDNLDSFTRSQHRLTRGDALSLAHLLTLAAHQAGLAVAQKNLAGLSRERRRSVGFDFAVSEECMVWHECNSYRSAYGRHVIEIEYTDNGRHVFQRACADHGDSWSIVLRDKMLRPPGRRGHVFATC
ncbi:MAG: endo alpha-1,4 polygalactosaminidase [Nocardioidaceae bacterium]